MTIRNMEQFIINSHNFFPDEGLSILSGLPGDDDVKEEDDKPDDLPDEEDEDKDAKDDDKDGDGGEEGDDDKEEDEDDEEEEENEEDEDSEVDDKVLTSWTDIKKKYPNFAKEFPDVKNALFREQQFSEAFPTPGEAKEAIERIQVFDQLAEDIVGQGNIINLLDHVKEKNKESYQKIIYSLLPHLQENDKDFYYDIAARPIKQLLRAAWAEGNGEKTDLGKAAAHIHKFFFKNINFEEKVKSEGGKEPDSKSKREQELEDRLTRIEDGKHNEFMSSIDDSYISKMTSHIKDGLNKDERLTEWSKAKIVEDFLKGIKQQLTKDTRYTSTLQSLLIHAKSAGFTNDFKTRIINAALVRAKSLVPDVRKRVVGDALKANGKKANSEDKKEEKVERRERKSTPSNLKESKKPMSDLDILRS